MNKVRKDAFKRIRQIQIKTTRKVKDLFAGAYHSAFKGRGIEFEEVREYQPGDEIRQIDWNVTARLQNPYVKLFKEERELTILLVVDVSASTHLGSGLESKGELIAEIGAILAYAAIHNQDRVGLLLFSDQIELFLRPKKSPRHVLRVIRELLYFQPKHQGTNLEEALTFLGKVQKKQTVCFVISDFLSEGFEHSLTLLAKRHEIIALHMYDPIEQALPNIGLAYMEDLENQIVKLVDTQNETQRKEYAEKCLEQEKKIKKLCSNIGVSYLPIRTNQSSVEVLRRFFKARRIKR